MRPVLFQFLKPASTWPLVWEPMVLEPMWGRRGPRRDVDVPFRRCPHRGYFFDDHAAPPRLKDAWGIFDLPGCTDEWCRLAWCQHLTVNTG